MISPWAPPLAILPVHVSLSSFLPLLPTSLTRPPLQSQPPTNNHWMPSPHPLSPSLQPPLSTRNSKGRGWNPTHCTGLWLAVGGSGEGQRESLFGA
eukprot:109988-Rhodomonas_salina.1